MTVMLAGSSDKVVHQEDFTDTLTEVSVNFVKTTASLSSVFNPEAQCPGCLHHSLFSSLASFSLCVDHQPSLDLSVTSPPGCWCFIPNVVDLDHGPLGTSALVSFPHVVFVLLSFCGFVSLV